MKKRLKDAYQMVAEHPRINEMPLQPGDVAALQDLRAFKDMALALSLGHCHGDGTRRRRHRVPHASEVHDYFYRPEGVTQSIKDAVYEMRKMVDLWTVWAAAERVEVETTSRTGVHHLALWAFENWPKKWRRVIGYDHPRYWPKEALATRPWLWKGLLTDIEIIRDRNLRANQKRCLEARLSAYE